MNEPLIKSVDGVAIPCPSAFQLSVMDISAADSGRTQDTKMHKNRVGQKRQISLAWNGLTKEKTTQIVQMFQPEYFKVEYYDIYNGKYETRTFYRGDVAMPVKWWYVGKQIIESLSFDIIER